MRLEPSIGPLPNSPRRPAIRPSLRGAHRATRQSRSMSVRRRRDCFAALAMTRPLWSRELGVHYISSAAIPLPAAQNSAAERLAQIESKSLIYCIFPSQREGLPRAETGFVPEIRDRRAEAA